MKSRLILISVIFSLYGFFLKDAAAIPNPIYEFIHKAVSEKITGSSVVIKIEKIDSLCGLKEDALLATVSVLVPEVKYNETTNEKSIIMVEKEVTSFAATELDLWKDKEKVKLMQEGQCLE